MCTIISVYENKDTLFKGPHFKDPTSHIYIKGDVKIISLKVYIPIQLS